VSKFVLNDLPCKDLLFIFLTAIRDRPEHEYALVATSRANKHTTAQVANTR